MNSTYLLLNIGMLGLLVAGDLLGTGSKAVLRKSTWKVIIILLILTAIFDNLIVGLGIVHYDSSKISGLLIGYAPIGDFFYAVAAPIIVLSLSTYYEKHR